MYMFFHTIDLFVSYRFIMFINVPTSGKYFISASDFNFYLVQEIHKDQVIKEENRMLSEITYLKELISLKKTLLRTVDSKMLQE